MKPTAGKKQSEITREWGRIARLRAEQIKEGKDLSYTFVLLPCVKELTMESDFRNVLDVGCGTGMITRELADKGGNIVGVDISDESIRVAKESCRECRNVEFVNSAIEVYAEKIKKRIFTLAVANMSLMTVLNLEESVEAVGKIVKKGGHFVVTITHPCFWPLYWGYAFEKWFNYSEEIPIEAEFMISLDRLSGIVTTHVHRPLNRYIEAVGKAGFTIDKLVEPIPSFEIEKKYPKKWEYPRFLAMRCIKS
jgi:SAM-dependent methyltransferase